MEEIKFVASFCRIVMNLMFIGCSGCLLILHKKMCLSFQNKINTGIVIIIRNNNIQNGFTLTLPKLMAQSNGIMCVHLIDSSIKIFPFQCLRSKSQDFSLPLKYYYHLYYVFFLNRIQYKFCEMVSLEKE